MFRCVRNTALMEVLVGDSDSYLDFLRCRYFRELLEECDGCAAIAGVWNGRWLQG